MLALPVNVRAQLIIPATVGTVACTQGGLGEAPGFDLVLSSITQNSLIVGNSQITHIGNAAYDVYLELLENSSGGLGISKSQKLGRLTDSSTPISAGTTRFSGLKKNTRYVAILHTGNTSSPLTRQCFKTRGEFSNADQNLNTEGTATLDLAKNSRTGCFAVVRTRQDITDCMCNGTRGGTLILAGQTTESQEARRRLGCPNLDS